MQTSLGSTVLVSLMLAVGACGSEASDDRATAVASPTPHGTPVPPFVSQTTPTVTISITDVPTPTIVYPSKPDLRSDLALNRAKWQAAAVKNYRYDFTISCFCGFAGLPITMVAHDGELVSMTDSSGARVTAGPAYDVFQPYSTVERMFQQTETDIQNASGVAVTYDAEYGFPTEILVGSRGRVTDSGSAVGISQFEILP